MDKLKKLQILQKSIEGRIGHAWNDEPDEVTKDRLIENLKEQLAIQRVSDCEYLDLKKYSEKIHKFHETLNNEIGENIKPYMPQTIKIIRKFKEIFLNSR